MRSRRTIRAALALVGASLCLAAAATAEDTPPPPGTTDPGATTTAPAPDPGTTTDTTAPAATTVVTDPTASTPAAATTAAATTTTVAATTTTVPAVEPAPDTKTGETITSTDEQTTTDETTTTDATTAALELAPPPGPGCVVVGAVGVVTPAHKPRVVGPAASAPPVSRIANDAFAYPADGSVVEADGANLSATCGPSAAAGGVAAVHAVSLFGGAVTANWVTIGVDGSAPKRTFSGLRVNGKQVALAPGGRVRLGSWGYLVAPSKTSPTRKPAGATGTPAELSLSALSVELVEAHAGLPAGTVVLVPYAGVDVEPATPTPTTTAETTTAARAAKHAAPRSDVKGPTSAPGSAPLTVTPPLRAGPYTFPVAGAVQFGDSYGGARSDVSGGWHHGDDIFAALGTPVVAVADGTLNRVGWERIGGWRLWVRDRAGDEFYYAHLSGYTPLALSGGKVRVKAGDVLGFVGNTGDAITTQPHLHFEVHPRKLLHLQYDGAVDPTTYLYKWARLARVSAPRPVHPRLPLATAARLEAQYVFRELLRARGVPAERPVGAAAVAAAATRPLVPFEPPLPTVLAVAPARAPRTLGPLVVAGIAAVVACALLGAFLVRRRRPGEPVEGEAG